MAQTNTEPQPARRALVTGSARGIGLAIARELFADGCHVVGVDLRAAEDKSPFVEFHAGLDLADPGHCEELLTLVGPVDIFVNNAAYFLLKPLHETTVEDFDRTIAINQRAPLWLARGFLPAMVESGWGRVVNLSSVGARTGGIQASGVYNGTKAAVISMTKFLARNFGQGNVTVNAVAPGAVNTAMTAHLTAAGRETFLREIPAGRFAEPLDIAGPVAFLCSERASYVNGVTLDVNGGWVMV